MLYFAYGSNLNVAAMKRRCPAALPLCRFTLTGSRLVFRGVADVAVDEAYKVIGALWRITPECEEALDRYEGLASGMYKKEYALVTKGNKKLKKGERVMFYVMNSTGIFPPSEGYLKTIEDGYRDFKLPMKQLNAAVLHSWKEKAPSHRERQRYRRTGRPPLAEPRAKTGMPTTGNQLALPYAGD